MALNDHPGGSSTDYRKILYEEWTRKSVVDAWAKWRPKITKQRQQVADALLRQAALPTGATVLDLGCGTGEFALRIAEEVGPEGHVHAVDWSEGMLEIARREAKPNLHLHLLDAHDLPFAAGSFDVVTSHLSAMYFAELGRVFAEAHRVLRPGGRLVVSAWGMPDQGDYFATCLFPFLMRSGVEAPPPGVASSLRFAPPGALSGELTKAGFKHASETRSLEKAAWPGPPEDLLKQVMQTSVGLGPIFEGLTAVEMAEARTESLTALEKLYNGRETVNTVELVIGQGTKD